MRKISVEVRNDHLEYLAKVKPLTALAELIWNALDADATTVRISFDENPLGGLESIRITDNGYGLDYDRALTAFGNLGAPGSVKRARRAPGARTLHGKYGKGRFRAFAIGNHVQWDSCYGQGTALARFAMTGHGGALGDFEVTDPTPAPANDAAGVTVTINDLAKGIDILRGVKALQEVTDLFALYLQQYPGVQVIYDGVPLDPLNSSDQTTELDLGTLVMPDGEQVGASVTVVEWSLPAKRGIVLCDEQGFALHPIKKRLLFRGFSYTAFLKSSHMVALDREGLLPMEDMCPDLATLLDAARTALRQHFTLREAEKAQEVLLHWQRMGLYPYTDVPRNDDEEAQRRIFDIYATHLNTISDFKSASVRNKRLILRMLQEMVRTEPTAVTRILDEMVTFPEDKEEAVSGILEERTNG